MSIFRKVYGLFNPRERRQLMLLMAAVVVMALLEMVGVASIMPFMALAANPELAVQNEWLNWLYTSLGFQSSASFLFFLGVVVLAIIALGNAFTAFTTWAMLRFVWKKHDRLSVELLGSYLNEPYGFHLNRNSTALGKNVLAEVFAVIYGVVVPGMHLVSRLVVVVFIIALLVWVDPVLALIVGVVLGGAYAGVYAAVRGRQGRLGRERVTANSRRYKLAGEAFGGIKELKVMGREAELLRMYGTASRSYSDATASNAMVQQLPRYALETVAFGGIIVIVLYLLQAREDFGQVIPILALYAFAGYRLMPALQQVFHSLAQIRFHTAPLDDLHEDLSTARERNRLRTQRADVGVAAAGSLPFEHGIRLANVSYTYPGAATPALREVSLTIPRNRTIGLVGTTGSGKTTLADLVLGLHKPSDGSILIDGTELDDATLPLWRQRLGYVPQQIFLSDDTVVRNIAFGIPAEQVDRAQVERAARIAHLHDFVAGLPDGYDTVVGERGVRLSGGQRQRIGVARALYHDPDVLVMDEATSALDGATEEVVMEAIRELARTRTIILIAHRLSTVRGCDTIHLLEHGRIVAAGSYTELMEASPYFRAMAGQGVSA